MKNDNGMLPMDVERQRDGEWYRSMLDEAGDLIQSIAPDGHVYYANKAWQDVLGYSEDEIAALTLWDIIHPDHLSHCQEVFQKVISGEPAVNIETVFVTRDGKSIPVEGNANCRFREGKPEYTWGIFRDITERKRVEEDYRQLLEDMNDGYAVIQDGKYVFANGRLAEILGYEPEQVLGAPIEKFMTPGERRAAMDLYEKSMHSEDVSLGHYEGETIRGDGRRVIVESSGKLIQYEGKPAFSVILRDITERRQTEEKYRQLIEDMSDGYLIIQDGKYVLANRRVGEIFGFDAKQLTDRTIVDFVLPGSHQAVREQYEKILSGEPASVKRFEGPAVRGDGTEIVIEASIKGIEYEGKSGLCVIVRDITERRQTEEKYRQLVEDMNDAYVVVQDGKYVFANRRFAESIGYELEQVIGMSVFQVTPSADRQALMNLYERVLNAEELPSGRFESSGIKKDGDLVVSEASIRPIQYEGKPAFSVILRDITERKQTEEKYRNLLEDMSDGYVVIQDGKYVFANRRFAEIFGYDPGQVIGMPVGEFAVSDNRQWVIEQHEKLLRGEEIPARQLETVGRKQDGTRVAAETTVKVIQYEGKPAVYVVIRDITDRKQTEEKYRQLVEDMSDGYVVFQDGKAVFANPRFCDIYGYEMEEVLGKSLADFSVPEKRRGGMELYERIMCGEVLPPERREGTGVKKDGTTIIAETTSKVIRYEDKPALAVITRDITGRRRAEAILRESEEKLRLIFKSVPEGIIVYDLEGDILDVNEGAVRMHGYDTMEELVGRKGFELVAERYHARIEEARLKSVLTGNVGTMQCSLVRKDGSEFQAMLSAAMLRDANDRPAGFVVVAVDVTEQQRMQEQLMLADRLASIGQLAAGIAHEVNNPLTGVIGFSELLLEKGLPDEVKQDLEIVNREAKRAADVIKGLLSFVRSGGGGKIPVDVNDIMREVLQLRSYEQKTSNIVVDEQLAPSLPPVMASGSQMQQVFMNLIINAEQAMLEAHGKGRLEIATEKSGDIIRVSVSDDGPGISHENMRKLFTPFFTTREVGKGTGLGLSICHGIVTEHGGRIYAESEPGKGATFVVELPVAVSRGR